MSKQTTNWKKVAKEVWPKMLPVRPHSFTKYKGQLQIVVDGKSIVIVIEGRDLEKIKMIL